jgi:hypothetical protein
MSALKKKKFVIDSDNEKEVKVEIINKEQTKPTNEDVLKLKRQVEAIKLKKKEEEQKKPPAKSKTSETKEKQILGKRKVKEEVTSESYSSYSSSGSSSSSSSCSSGEESPMKKSVHKAKKKADGSEKPLNLTKKIDVVDELLCRWWYAIDSWPKPSDYQYIPKQKRVEATGTEKSRHR